VQWLFRLWSSGLWHYVVGKCQPLDMNMLPPPNELDKSVRMHLDYTGRLQRKWQGERKQNAVYTNRNFKDRKWVALMPHILGNPKFKLWPRESIVHIYWHFRGTGYFHHHINIIDIFRRSSNYHYPQSLGASFHIISSSMFTSLPVIQHYIVIHLAASLKKYVIRDRCNHAIVV